MNFLSSVFFIVLTIGIPYAYARDEWTKADIRNSVCECLFTFVNEVLKMANSNAQPLNMADQSIKDALRNKSYRMFIEFIDEKFKPAIMAIDAVSRRNEVRNLVKQYAACINGKNNLPRSYKYQATPFRNYLRNYYRAKLYPGIDENELKNILNQDCPPSQSYSRDAGTSSTGHSGPAQASTLASSMSPNVSVPNTYYQGTSPRLQFSSGPPVYPPSVPSSSPANPDTLEIQSNHDGTIRVAPRWMRHL